MKKKLYLHIGMGKTGTTALQHFFWENRKALAAHDICYPELGVQSSAHHLLSPHVPDYMRQRWDFLPPAQWAPLLAERAQSTVLLSSEVMFSADGEEISNYFAAVRDHFDIRDCLVQNQAVNPIHVLAHEFEKGLEAIVGIARFFEWDYNAQCSFLS